MILLYNNRPLLLLLFDIPTFISFFFFFFGKTRIVLCFSFCAEPITKSCTRARARTAVVRVPFEAGTSPTRARRITITRSLYGKSVGRMRPRLRRVVVVIRNARCKNVKYYNKEFAGIVVVVPTRPRSLFAI